MPIDYSQLDSVKVDKPENRAPTNSLTALIEKLNSIDLIAHKVSSDDRMFFTEQLSLMLETGNGLVPSLNSLKQQSENPALTHIIEEIAEDVNNGHAFSRALRRHTELFSSTYINLIEVSEQGGFMAEVLAELLEMDEKKARLDATLKAALSYPAFLMIFSVVVVIFILVAVFPRFSAMFVSIADDLPITTQVLMSVSTLLIQHWPFVVAGLVVTIYSLYRWTSSDSGRSRLDHWKLNLPILKNIFSELYLVQSMRVMALSLGNGVSIMDTLASCRDVVKNQEFQDFLSELESAVQEGKGVSQGFQTSPFIPGIVKQMITTGEQTGNLSKVMHRIASYYDRQLEKRLAVIAKSAEPVMLIVMGVIVGSLVSAIILPILQLSRVSG